MSDPIEEGYRLLAQDSEMSMRRKFAHHCGFDFKPEDKTAKCACGAVATNPFWSIKGENKWASTSQ